MNYLSIAFSRAVADELVANDHIKVASDRDLEKLAQIADKVGSWINVNLAEGVPADLGIEVADAILKEAGDTGSLITGDKPEQDNTPQNASSQVGGPAAMDEKERPEGTYLEGSGKTKLDTAKGHVGDQEQHAKSPKDEEKSNSATADREKSATIHSILAKLSGDTGSLITGDKPEQDNTPENAAAQVGGLAALDQEERPEGSYLVGVGNSDLDTRKGHVGKEEVHPKSPKDEQKSNSPIEERAKSAGVTPAYLQLFEETASKVLPKIASAADEDDRISAVKACMGLTSSEREAYISRFNKEASERVSDGSAEAALKRIGDLLKKR